MPTGELVLIIIMPAPKMQNRRPAWHFVMFSLCAWAAG